MPSKPAARATDMAMTCNDPTDLPVGTVIAVGTVMINNLPAAKQGDKIVGVDTHIIMIPSPGGPIPTPLPHPYAGTIDADTITNVNIMGKPAAVVGSGASNQPPHIPQGGPFQKPPSNKAKIMLGSLNVMIGDQGGSGSGSDNDGETEIAQTAAQAVEVKEGHKLDVKFVDKGGKPIMGAGYKIKTPDNQQIEGPVVGEVKKSGVEEGDHEVKIEAITDARWSAEMAEVGEKVQINIKTAGIEDSEEAEIQVFVKDANYADRLFETIPAEVSGNKIEAEWELKIDEKLLEHQNDKTKIGRYSAPFYYFIVKVANLQQKSGLLRYRDWVEFEAKDEDGNAIKGVNYKLTLPNGEIREGKMDNGEAREEHIPPGKSKADFSLDEEDKKK